MKMEIIKAGPIDTNCYVVLSGEKSLVIDCGGVEVAEFLCRNNVKDVTLLLTHGHYDHIAGIDELKKKIPCVRVYALCEEKDVIEDPEKNCSNMFDEGSFVLSDVIYKNNGDILKFDNYDIKLIHTPGHTKGGCCYYIDSEKVLFSGDTLFYHTSGRTDLPTGNIREIVKSVGKYLMPLSDDVKVYPGHDKMTTIGEERRENEIVATYNMRKSWD